MVYICGNVRLKNEADTPNSGGGEPCQLEVADELSTKFIKEGESMTQPEEAYKLMLTEYPDLLSAKQIGAILGVSRQYVYGMINDGYIFGVKVGKSYRVSKIRLIEYLIGNRVA
jgi:excisionase family DNA binding protein